VSEPPSGVVLIVVVPLLVEAVRLVSG